MQRRGDQSYISIRQALTSIEKRVNFFGAIIELNFPRRSKGTDWFCTLKLVDPTGVIVVNVFMETADQLPRVAALGDIIQFRHVMVKPYGVEVNAVFHKKFSTFALYERHGHAINPYHASSNFHLRGEDSHFLVRLRHWFVGFQFDGGLPSIFSSLSKITNGEQANLIFKVLHLYQDATNKWMALVWDGTDCPPNTVSSVLETEKDNPISLTLDSAPLPRDMLLTFPTVGSILRIWIERDIDTHATRILSVGKWVKSYNISMKIRDGMWFGMLTSTTKLQYTPDNDHLVSACERSHLDRLSAMEQIPDGCNQITEVGYYHTRFSTLMDVITSPEVVATFRCMARVIAMCPWRVEEFCYPEGVYRIRVTLEDPTARIHAYVYQKDGNTLFGKWRNTSVDLLTRKRNALLGITTTDSGQSIESPRNPPYADLCLKSYCRDENDPWGSRRYRIFDTKIVL